jgi:hypothetical protein
LALALRSGCVHRACAGAGPEVGDQAQAEADAQGVELEGEEEAVYAERARAQVPQRRWESVSTILSIQCRVGSLVFFYFSLFTLLLVRVRAHCMLRVRTVESKVERLEKNRKLVTSNHRHSTVEIR